MKKNFIVSIVLLLILSALIVISFGIGSKFINIGEIIDIILNKQIFSSEINPINKKIILQIRLPRILFSVIAGMSLSISGLIYQTILKNPLAEPFTLGVSSGATLGGYSYIYFGLLFEISISDISFRFHRRLLDSIDSVNRPIKAQRLSVYLDIYRNFAVLFF